MDTGTIETPDGKVVGVFMKQVLGTQQQKIQIEGTVVGKQLKLTLDGNNPLKPAPWNDQVLGLFKQHTILKDREAKPGDTFTYLSFEPTINLVMKAECIVKGLSRNPVDGDEAEK